MAEVIVEFLTGFVDERGGIWVKGSIMSVLPEFAEMLVSKGIAKYAEPPKAVKPALPRKDKEDK